MLATGTSGSMSGDGKRNASRATAPILALPGQETLAGLSSSLLKIETSAPTDRPRSANLVERIETATRATGPQTAAERLRRVAEQRAGQVVIGTAEVWIVEDIEELGSETEPHLLGDVKLALQPKIRL